MVIGARGSGDSMNGNIKYTKYHTKVAGMGLPTATFAVAFANLLPKGQVSTVAVPYDAVGVGGTLRKTINAIGARVKIPKLGAYNDSVAQGESLLSQLISTEVHICPRVKLILTGYSQGAQVTANVYQKLNHSQREQVLGVVLFGDPLFNPNDKAARGNYLKSQNGSLGRRRIYAGSSQVLSFCHLHDPVCQGLAWLVKYGFTQHENYDKLGEPQKAADILLKVAIPKPKVGQGSAPTVVTPPELTGEKALLNIPLSLLGNTVSVDQGTWKGSPTAFNYQWYRCDSPPTIRSFTNCASIDGATQSTYTLLPADLGHTIQVKVRASNIFGSGSSYGYTHTANGRFPGLIGNVGAPNPIVDDSFADDNGVSCGSDCQVHSGDTLTFHPGTWDGQGGSAAITFSYQWQTCKAVDTDCTSIEGATGPTYTVQPSDGQLRVKVVGANAYGANGIYYL